MFCRVQRLANKPVRTYEDMETICRALAADTMDPVERVALLELAENYRELSNTQHYR